MPQNLISQTMTNTQNRRDASPLRAGRPFIRTVPAPPSR